MAYEKKKKNIWKLHHQHIGEKLNFNTFPDLLKAKIILKMLQMKIESWEEAKKVNIFVIFSGNNLCNFEIGAAEAAVMAELLQFHHAIASLHPPYASWSSN